MTDVEKSEVSPHVEHFQIYPHDRGVESQICHICHVCDVENVSTKVKLMLQIAVFCRGLRCFVAKYVLS